MPLTYWRASEDIPDARRSIRIFRALSIGILLSTVLVARAPASDTNCLSGANSQELAKSVLTEKTELAHPAVDLSLPSSPRSVVLLVRPANDVNTNFEGWVAVPTGTASCAYRTYGLPPMTERPGRFEIEALAVFAAAAGPQRKRNLVVLYRYHRNGSEQDSGYASKVYEWTGNGFEFQAKLADLVVGLKTASAIRSKLRDGR
jgi:hypothetical protein